MSLFAAVDIDVGLASLVADGVGLVVDLRAWVYVLVYVVSGGRKTPWRRRGRFF